jgi:hypothetical protein
MQPVLFRSPTLNARACSVSLSCCEVMRRRNIEVRLGNVARYSSIGVLVRNQHAASSACWLLSLLFDPEHIRNIFLRNVTWLYSVIFQKKQLSITTGVKPQTQQIILFFYLCGVHPVALFTYTIWTYNIYYIYIYVIRNRNSLYFVCYLTTCFGPYGPSSGETNVSTSSLSL